MRSRPASAAAGWCSRRSRSARPYAAGASTCHASSGRCWQRCSPRAPWPWPATCATAELAAPGARAVRRGGGGRRRARARAGDRIDRQRARAHPCARPGERRRPLAARPQCRARVRLRPGGRERRGRPGALARSGARPGLAAALVPRAHRPALLPRRLPGRRRTLRRRRRRARRPPRGAARARRRAGLASRRCRARARVSQLPTASTSSRPTAGASARTCPARRPLAISWQADGRTLAVLDADRRHALQREREAPATARRARRRCWPAATLPPAIAWSSYAATRAAA